MYVTVVFKKSAYVCMFVCMNDWRESMYVYGNHCKMFPFPLSFQIFIELQIDKGIYFDDLPFNVKVEATRDLRAETSARLRPVRQRFYQCAFRHVYRPFLRLL